MSTPCQSQDTPRAVGRALNAYHTGAVSWALNAYHSGAAATGRA